MKKYISGSKNHSVIVEDDKLHINVKIENEPIVIHDGYVEFMNDELPWSMSKDDPRGNWYYGSLHEGTYLNVADPSDVAENALDTILDSDFPDDPGKYFLSADVELVYLVQNIEKHREYFEGEDGLPEYFEDAYMDDVEVEFSEKESSAKNVKVEKAE